MGTALALNRAGLLNGLTEQQQLFSHGGFTRVRVGNNGKSPPFADFRTGAVLTHEYNLLDRVVGRRRRKARRARPRVSRTRGFDSISSASATGVLFWVCGRHTPR